MAQKTVVITGANRGLGLEIVRQLDSDASISKIYALCRKTSEQLASLARTAEKISVIQDIDVTQDDCIPKLQSTFKSGENHPVRNHLLINNAGAYGPPEPFTSLKEIYASQSLDTITMD
jgi:NAD(P)-dependent dehydrogenase (short-subunit alcohol dehydrogenase family)